jgi:Recombination endonuclease VII
MDWTCRYCGSTDPADIRVQNRKFKHWTHCCRCRPAYQHHIPWKTYALWRERGCKICAYKPQESHSRKKYLEVDHDHSCCPGPYSCGRCVRGLLCHHHNQLIREIENGTVDRLRAHMKIVYWDLTQVT